MAEKKKRRVVRKAEPETVRQKAQKAQDQKPKEGRKVRRAIKKASQPVKKPLGKVVGFIKRILSPFSFLLKPFKTKPAKAVGRFLNKVLLLSYFIKSWQELRKVEWPNRRQTVKLTTAVFLFAIGLTSVIAGTDWVLDKLFKQLLLR